MISVAQRSHSIHFYPCQNRWRTFTVTAVLHSGNSNSIPSQSFRGSFDAFGNGTGGGISIWMPWGTCLVFYSAAWLLDSQIGHVSGQGATNKDCRGGRGTIWRFDEKIGDAPIVLIMTVYNAIQKCWWYCHIILVDVQFNSSVLLHWSLSLESKTFILSAIWSISRNTFVIMVLFPFLLKSASNSSINNDACSLWFADCKSKFIHVKNISQVHIVFSNIFPTRIEPPQNCVDYQFLHSVGVNTSSMFCWQRFMSLNESVNTFSPKGRVFDEERGPIIASPANFFCHPLLARGIFKLWNINNRPY